MEGKIRLVALDLDGTLLNRDKQIGEKTMKAMKQAADLGIYLVPVTGRPAEGLPQSVLNIPGLQYTITSNGATIRNIQNGENIRQLRLSPQIGTEILERTKHFHMIREVFRHGVGYMERSDFETLKMRYAGTSMYNYLLGTRSVLETTVEQSVREDPDPIEELFFLTESPEMRAEVQEALRNLEGIAFAHPSERDLEVFSMGADKGSALEWIADYLGIACEEIMAVGDEGSDIPMLKAAGLAVAMENGSEETKQASQYITASCDEDGVGLAIEKFILKK